MTVNPAHRDHDQLLIARMASGDADAVDTKLAERQLAACDDCRTLLTDLGAIRSATVAGVLRVPPRPRSFRFSPDDLERLHAPAWRRWLGRLGAPRFDLVRPLATAVAGIGLAVVVLGSALPGAGPAALFRAAGAPSAGAEGTDPSAQGTATPAGETDGFGAPATVPDRTKSTSEPTRAVEAAGPGGPKDIGLSSPSEPASIPVAPIGVVLLGSGLALVVLSTAARRAAGR